MTTYRELAIQLLKLNEEQLDQTVTIYSGNQDEYHGVVGTHFTSKTDVLDADHFYLEID